MNRAHSAAIRMGLINSQRILAARNRVSLIVGALQRTGHGDLLAPPRFHDAGIRLALERLAHAADPATDEGRAILHSVALSPGAVMVWLRRHREQVYAMLSHEQTAGAAQATGGARSWCRNVRFRLEK